MCAITEHARLRSRERWGIGKARNVDEIIRDTYERAQTIGEYMDGDKPKRLMLDASNRRVLVVNPDEDRVITVWVSRTPPLAIDMYRDVIALHKRKIGATQRKIRTVMARYNRQKDTLQAERDRLDAEIKRLTLERDAIDATLDNFRNDLATLNEQKRTTLYSMSHYIANESVAGVEVGVQ